MVKCIAVFIICLLSTQVMAGDVRTWKDVRNKQTDYNYGRQWIVIKETSCLITKGRASYSTRYYVYEDRWARTVLERFNRRYSRGGADGEVFVSNMEEKGYFTSRHAASSYLNRYKQEDPDWQRRLY